MWYFDSHECELAVNKTSFQKKLWIWSVENIFVKWSFEILSFFFFFILYIKNIQKKEE